MNPHFYSYPKHAYLCPAMTIYAYNNLGILTFAFPDSFEIISLEQFSYAQVSWLHSRAFMFCKSRGKKTFQFHVQSTRVYLNSKRILTCNLSTGLGCVTLTINQFNYNFEETMYQNSQKWALTIALMNKVAEASPWISSLIWNLRLYTPHFGSGEPFWQQTVLIVILLPQTCRAVNFWCKYSRACLNSGR